MKLKIALIIVVVLILLFFAWLFWPTSNQIIYLDGNAIQIEVADNMKERYQGLSGREELCGECGMLFIFNDQAPRTFSMRGMNFPLDFIWIKNNIVVSINEAIYPAQNGGEVLIDGPICNYVLEVNSGYSKKHNIKIGDKLEIKS